jgi:hypothetical protein
MKTTMITVLGLLLIGGVAHSQNRSPRQKITVLSVEAKSIPTDPFVLGNQVRVELEKLERFAVTDKHEITQVMEANHLSLEHCFGKSCLIEVGKLLNSDKMFSATIDDLGPTLGFTFRVIDVRSGMVDQEYVHEFLDIPAELHNMIRLSIADMFRRNHDTHLMRKLTKPNDFDNINNNPNQDRLALDGPRMGFVTFTGDLRERITAPRSRGGLDCYPYMFQFGYQFEKQYLNEGQVQALFEFIPMITGLDQAKFMPSFSLLHGLRSNVNGWEFAFGPTINFVIVSSGYYNGDRQWVREREWRELNHGSADVVEPEFIERLDNRGDLAIRSSFVIAAGRTFKSGRLNIPVNVFVVPGKSGWRVGCSFGFNARNMK